MGNLLDSASIVLTPTAYDNGKMLSVKPNDGDGDFDFSRNSAATRVNAQGLVENVQILSGDLVSNGDFSQEGAEEISNGSFSQEGAEEITNGDFATDSDWSKGTGWSISGGTANAISQESFSNLSQSNVMESGKIYAVTFTISNYIEGGVQPLVGGMTSLGDGTIRTGNGTYTEYIESDGTRFYIRGISFTGSIDNVSVKEVGQDWALGTSWSIGEDKAISDGRSGNLYQVGTVTPNKQYKIQATVSDYVSGNVEVSAGAVPRGRMSANGTYTFYQTASTTSNFFVVSNSFNGSITNISVKEVRQGWSLNGADFSLGSVFFDNVNANIFQSKSFTVGKKYRFSFSGSGNLSYRTGYAGTDAVKKPITLPHTVDIVATSDTNRIQPYGAIDGSQGTLTSVVVKEITDDTNLPRINYEGFSYQDVLGPELVTNGDFATDTNWVKGAGWIISGGSANANNATSDLYQENVVESGKYYKVTYTISNYVSGSVRVEIPSNAYDGALRTANGTYTEILLSGGTIILFDGRTSFNGSIDNVSVKEVLGQEVVPDSGCGSWLLEPQSTNLVPYSEDLESFPIKSGISVISNAAISPDGLQNASKLIPATSNNANHYIRTDISVVNGSEYVMSFFAKKGEYNYVNTYTSAYSTGVTATWDLNAGVVALGSPNADIEDYGNGWYRCIWKGTTNTTSLSYRIYVSEFEDRNTSFAGDGVKGAYVYGAMLEKQSYATSYIPTNGATTTRLQDIANNSGNASLINSTEGVLYAEISGVGDGGTRRYISLSDGGNSNDVRLYLDTNGYISALTKVGGSTQAFLSTNAYAQNNFNKIAFKYKENDFALWVNGVEVATDNSGLVNAANTFNELAFFGNGLPFYGKTKALVVYKEALTDEQLTCLTTI